jgi:hypothetical protein
MRGAVSGPLPGGAILAIVLFTPLFLNRHKLFLSIAFLLHFSRNNPVKTVSS